MGKHSDKMTMRDHIINSKNSTPNAVKNGLRSAVPFVISDRAQLKTVEAIWKMPEFLAHNLEFARLPFSPMWIEYNELNPETGASASAYYLEESNSGEVISFIPYIKRLTGEITSFRYSVELSLSETYERRNATELDYKFIFGRLYERMNNIDMEYIFNRVLVEKFPNDGDNWQKEGRWGDIPLIIGILLMINQPGRITILQDIPKQRGLSNGKIISYWGHTEVDIVLDAKPKEILGCSHSRTAQRWHTVRGHWFHRGGKKSGCLHEWEKQSDAKHYICSLCERKRTWREYPEGRGSAQVGYIKQSRRIRLEKD